MCHPLQRLPAEIWSEIAGYLPSAALLNFANASPILHEITKEKCSSFQLQAVLTILDKRAEMRNLISLSLEDLLTIRLVCRKWDEAVRQYYSRGIYQYPDHFIDAGVGQTYDLGLTWSYLRKEIHFHSPRGSLSYAKLINNLRLTHPPESGANPVFSRNLFIKCGSILEVITSWGPQLQVVQNWGRHILRLTVSFNYNLASQYLRLVELLSYTPNLEYLEVVWGHTPKPHHILSQELAELRQTVGAGPIPEMGSLTTLVLNRLPSPIQSEILQKASQIEALTLTPNPNEYEDFLPVHLPNLRRIQLNLEPRSECLQAVRRLITPSWLQQLHTLKVHVFDEEGRSLESIRLESSAVSPFQEVVAFLNQSFQESPLLHNFHLVLLDYNSRSPSDRFFHDCRTCRLLLPHVEEVKLQAAFRIILDFLLPMAPSLKKLAVETRWDPANDFPFNSGRGVKEAVGWNGWLGTTLLRSNIWGKFPHLHFIRVESRKGKGWTYRRKGDNGTPVLIQKDGAEEGGGRRTAVARKLNTLLGTSF